MITARPYLWAYLLIGVAVLLVVFIVHQRSSSKGWMFSLKKLRQALPSTQK